MSDARKNDVPDHIREKAREMARQELARRLEELDMSVAEARGYGVYLEAVQGHIAQLHDLLESMSLSLSLLFTTLNQELRSGSKGGRASLGETSDRWGIGR